MDTGLESDTLAMHPLMSWRSVMAGVLIAFFVMTGLLGLGMAFGGIGLNKETTLQNAGLFTGVWFLVSALISLFAGSYFAARVSKFKTGRVGSAQGLVIAALFLGFFLYQMLSAIGSAGSLAKDVTQNPALNRAIASFTEDAVGDLNLRSNSEVVAQGLGSRLLQGDTEGAKNYLASHSAITSEEADARILSLKAKIDNTLAETKEAAAAALRSTGRGSYS